MLNKSTFEDLINLYFDYDAEVLSPLYDSEILNGDSKLLKFNSKILDLLIDQCEPYVDKAYSESIIIEYTNKIYDSSKKDLPEPLEIKVKNTTYIIRNFEELYAALVDIDKKCSTDSSEQLTEIDKAYLEATNNEEK